jgi:erythrocyte band 7 integral membrane protein
MNYVNLLLTVISCLLVVATFPVSLIFCFRVVQEYERVVVFRLGRLLKTTGPGIIFYLPCVDKCHIVDLRTKAFVIPRQDILTKDSLAVSLEAVVYYRILNPIAAFTEVTDVHLSTRLLAATTIRTILGEKFLSDIVSEGFNISLILRSVLNKTAHSWGVNVERFEIKEIHLPDEMHTVMSKEAISSREATAKIIVSDAERIASPALKEAGDILSGSGMSLRTVSGVHQIASKSNMNVVVV